MRRIVHGWGWFLAVVRRFARRLKPASREGARWTVRAWRSLLSAFRVSGVWLVRVWGSAGKLVRWWASGTADFFFRLKIRSKLSLLVAVSIAVVAIIVSVILADMQERELRSHTEVLGQNILRSLAAVAEDNLLLNSTPVLQDYVVKNFARQAIPGLERLFVVDRTGKIVAHLSVDSINIMVEEREWNRLMQADSARMTETASHFIFDKTIFVGAGGKRIFLGAASARFAKDILLAPIGEMRNRILLTSVSISLLAIAFVFGISKKIVHIIVVLSDAARRVGSGDLKVTVVTRNKDELGVLAQEFNSMVGQIRQKTEMQKFVSRSTVQMLAKDEEAKLGGTRRVVTILFTDVRDFTSVSEHRWPEEVVVTLNQYLDLQTTILHNHGGVVDKFIGDGIMTVFTGNDMAVRSVEAAMEIQRTIGQVNRRPKDKDAIALTVGIGVAAGPAVLGTIGSSDRMDYTVIGDTVNIAARLCGIAAPGEILVNEQVSVRLSKDYVLKSAGDLSLKGKREPVKVFRVLPSEKS